MKNYKQTATDVLRLVGGEKNVSQLEHCSTRLRFTLADPAKADVAALKKTPGVLVVIFMAFLERWCNKWCPKAIRVFFVPLFCFAVAFPVGLLLLGPLGYNIGSLLTTAILALYNTLGWLAVAIVAGVLPFMISLGMHKALVPYAVSSLADPGFDMLYLPASLAHNISEGGACLAVAIKTKDENLRSTAISAGISGLFGITEPALYGVTLQHKKVMGAVVASSFLGGLFIGLMKIKAFAAVGPGIASMPMYIDPDNGMNFVWACMAIAQCPLRRLACTARYYLASALRLLVYPLVVLGLLWAVRAAGWIPDGKAILMTVFLATITPACATITSMAQLYDCDVQQSSALYVLSTLLSILTMPLMLGLFDTLL